MRYELQTLSSVLYRDGMSDGHSQATLKLARSKLKEQGKILVEEKGKNTVVKLVSGLSGLTKNLDPVNPDTIVQAKMESIEEGAI